MNWTIKPKSFYAEQLEKARKSSQWKDLARFLDSKGKPFGTTFPTTKVYEDSKKIKVGYSFMDSTKPRLERKCIQCGDMFQWNYKVPKTAFDATKYCSMKCKRLGRSLEPIEKPCEYCGKIMIKSETQRFDRWRIKQFCNNTCHNYFRKHGKAKNKLAESSNPQGL